MADDQRKNEDSKRSASASAALVPIPLLALWWASQHQVQQQAIAASVVAGLALLWPLLNRDDLAKSTPGWLHAVTLQIERGWRESAAAGAEFFNKALLAMEPDAELPERVDVPFPAQEIQTAMRVTGPIEVKRQVAKARPIDEAMNAGEQRSEGVGVAKTIDGGRAQVAAQIEKVAPKRIRAKKAIGWARVTDDNPCYFCALLASKGAVYLNKSVFDASNSKYEGPGTVKVHDHCRCTIRPVFSKADFWDERAKFFLDQWEKFGRASTNSTAENNFRKQYVPPPPYSVSGLSDVEREQVIADAQRNLDTLLERGFEADSPNVQFFKESLTKLKAQV